MTPTVLLACACGRQPASSGFYDDFYRCMLPNDASKRMRVESNHVSRNMRYIIDLALTNGFDGVVYVDDDLRFEPDFVLRLLAHGKDRVAPLVCQRLPPFKPYIMDDTAEGFQYVPIPVGAQGLIEVPMFAGMPGWTSTDVLRRLPFPAFPENTWNGDEWLQGDLGFSRALKTLGVRTYCDLDCVVGHVGTYQVRQRRGADGAWGSEFVVNEGTLRAVAPTGATV